MGLYFGDIFVPFVSDFVVDKVKKQTQVIKHLGQIAHHVAEFKSDVRTFESAGVLMQVKDTIKTAEQFAGDLQSMVDRSAPYNSVFDIKGRTGWVSASEMEAPLTAEMPTVRYFTLKGLFLPKSKYTPRMHTVPEILSNPWSFVLGVNDCDNYVAIPIGATYSGGDGSVITRDGEDGTITLVLASTLANIKYDVSEDDIDNGEVKIWDEMGELLESDWIKVFSEDHEFTGKAVIQNGLYRVIIDTSTEYISLYRYSTIWEKIDDFTADTFNHIQIKSANPDVVIIKLSDDVEITIRRGHPILIDSGNFDLLAIASTPTDQTTTTDNYLVLAANTYICSDANFSIVELTKNLDSGKKWIFYEEVAGTAEDIAHQALVVQNLTRELIQR